jgi:hypothetical protein
MQLAVAIHSKALHHARKREDTQLDFTAWVESLKSVAQVLAGFGLVTILLAYIKNASERRCWDNYKHRTQQWIDELIRSQERHPNELTEDQWRFEVEQMLSDSHFGPMQVEQLLETAVLVAKGFARDRLSW